MIIVNSCILQEATFDLGRSFSLKEWKGEEFDQINQRLGLEFAQINKRLDRVEDDVKELKVMITKKKARKVNKKLREHCYMFIMFNRYKVAVVIQKL